jgi:hypothetical protein
MMWRARRLKEIAEANQPAFVSTTGTHWWLADVPSKPEPQQSVSPAPAAAASESKPVSESKSDEYFIALSSAADAKRAAAARAAEETIADSVSNSMQESVRFERTADAKEESLMWDAKSCCFVACA